MADTTALKNRIRAAIKANDNQEITGPVLQQALLDIVDELDLYPELENEVLQRQNADTTLQNNIDAEGKARQTADQTLNENIETLQENIDAEGKARQTADQTLQENIDAEGKARQTLQENIDAEGKARQTVDQILQENIDAEEQSRQNADTTLQNNIDAEAQSRQNADQTLQENIDAEGKARQTLQENIDAEGKARQTVDQILQENIDAEEQSRQNADTTLQNNIDAEAQSRQNADQTLNENIETLQENIDAEIQAEIDRATTAENAILNNITQITGDMRELTADVESQKAVTYELAKSEVTMTFNRYIGLSDVEKLYFDKYWSKDLQVHSSDAGMCCALLLKNCGYPLSWKCNNYGNWQYAILCNGVSDDGSIVDGKLCTDALIDATGYKYILLTEYQGNRILNIIPTYDYVYTSNGLAYWVEQKNGAEAVADEMRYASRLPGVLDEFKNGTIGWKMELEKDYINLRDAMKANNNNFRTFSLIRHFPYLNMSGKSNVVFGCWVNLVDIVWGDYVANSLMFLSCRNLEHVYGFEESGLTNIPDGIFMDCPKLTFGHLPSGVTSIGQYAFSGCSSLALTELPSGVTSIGVSAFSGCTSLALTELPAGVTSIGVSAFSGCTSLALTELPSGVTSIGRYTFQGCTSIVKMTFPEGLTTISIYSFNNCTGLREITIPTTVTTIEELAFGGTHNLSVTCLATTPPNIATYSFNGVNSISYIKVPAASVEAYKAASGWATFKDKITAIE